MNEKLNERNRQNEWNCEKKKKKCIMIGLAFNERHLNHEDK